MDAEDRRLISDRLPIKKKDKLNHVMISLLRFLTGWVVYANKLNTRYTRQFTTNKSLLQGQRNLYTIYSIARNIGGN